MTSSELVNQRCEVGDEQQSTHEINEERRWKDIRYLTDRPSKFAPIHFTPGIQNFETIQKIRILVVGAGGLGCEILKDLALSGFCNIDVIDMDTIDLSNLNRQFLFRDNDIGKSKAEMASAFIQKRVKGCRVTPHHCKIQDKPLSFYRGFHIIICGLDSIEARRWLNATVCSLVRFDEQNKPLQQTIVPLIDGGTEGFKGASRVILPFMSPCVECTLFMYPKQINYPLCTIASTPRLPEHCVEYVKMILWDEKKPFGEGVPLDADDPKHVNWVFEEALKRASEYQIQGVDLRLTQGVLKRIIPAVASTNAIIAGSCTLEVLKLSSNVSNLLDNYMMFSQIEGVSFEVVKLERNPDCLVCGGTTRTYQLQTMLTLSQFIEELKDKYELKNPSVRTSDSFLYEINALMPQMAEISSANLSKTLEELLVVENSELVIADESLTKPLLLRIKYAQNN